MFKVWEFRTILQDVLRRVERVWYLAGLNQDCFVRSYIRGSLPFACDLNPPNPELYSLHPG